MRTIHTIGAILVPALLILMFVGLGINVAFSIEFEIERYRYGDPALPPINDDQEFMDDQVFGDVKRAYVAFVDTAYDFEANCDYNQVFPVAIYNSTNRTFLLYTEVLHSHHATVGLNTVGIGSASYPALLEPQQQRTIFVKLHAQHFTERVLEASIRLIEATSMAEFDRVPLRFRFPEKKMDISLQLVEETTISQAQTWAIINEGETLADLTVRYIGLDHQAYLNPQIVHYRLKKGERVQFDLIPVLDGENRHFEGELVVTDGKHEESFPILFELETSLEYFLYQRASISAFNLQTHRNAIQPNADIDFTIPFWYVQTRSDAPTYSMQGEVPEQVVNTASSPPLQTLLPIRSLDTDHSIIMEDWNKDGQQDMIYPLEPDEEGDYPRMTCAMLKQDRWYDTNVEAVFAEIHLVPFEDVEWITPGRLSVYLNGVKLDEMEDSPLHGAFLFPLPPALLNLPENGTSQNTLQVYYDQVNHGSLAMIDEAKIWVRYDAAVMHMVRERDSDTQVMGKRNFFWEQPMIAFPSNSWYRTEQHSLQLLPVNIGFNTAQARITPSIRSHTYSAQTWEATNYELKTLSWQLEPFEFDDYRALLNYTVTTTDLKTEQPTKLMAGDVSSPETHFAFLFLDKQEGDYLNYLKNRREIPALVQSIDPFFSDLYCRNFDERLFQRGLSKPLEIVSYY
jgi:hypothetical protein